MDCLLAGASRPDDNKHGRLLGMVQDVVRIRYPSRETDNHSGEHLMLAVIVNEGRGAGEDKHKFVLRFMPVARGSARAASERHIVDAELREAGRLGKSNFSSSRIAITRLHWQVAKPEEPRLHRQMIDWPVDFQSLTKLARPMSVSGWSASFLITAGGMVATSAPASAACVT
jgi:hypothetical protein